MSKKLLILGANFETIPLVETAHSMGIKTITTDNNLNAPAKKISWKSFNIDGFDIGGLVDLAKNEQVDGILVGVADPLIRSYQLVCSILNMPCYINKKSCDVFSNKYLFKKYCEKHGILGVPEYTEKEAVYPVIVKPVDNCAGQGISICEDSEKLKDAINLAKNSSKKREYIIEKYMQTDDLLLYFTFVDNVHYISLIGDRCTLQQCKGSPVNLGSVYPSRFTDFYLNNYHQKFVCLFKDLGVSDGIMAIQAFIENDQLYVYDPGFRLQGEAPHLFLDYVNGIDHCKMLINFALGNNYLDYNFSDKNDCFLNGKYACTLWILLKPGKIKIIQGLKIDNMQLIHSSIRLKEGDVVEENMIGTEKQVFARFYLVCDTLAQLQSLSSYIRNSVKVFDEYGNLQNMI